MRLLRQAVVAVALSAIGGKWSPTAVEGSGSTALGSPSQSNARTPEGLGGITDREGGRGRNSTDIDQDEMTLRQGRVRDRAPSRRHRAQRGRQLALLTILGISAAALSLSALRLGHRKETDVTAVAEQLEGPRDVVQQAVPRGDSLATKSIGAVLVAVAVIAILLPGLLTMALKTGEDGTLLGDTSSFDSITRGSRRAGVRPVSEDLSRVALLVLAGALVTGMMVLNGVGDFPAATLPEAADADREFEGPTAEQRNALRWMMNRLHPAGVEDLISSVRQAYQGQVSDTVLSFLEGYLRATAETDEVAEKAFRVARVVTILQLRRMSELFGQATAAVESAKEAWMAGEQPRVAHGQADRWRADLLHIEEKLNGARELEAVAYPFVNSDDSVNAVKYLGAESASLLLRKLAISGILHNLETIIDRRQTPRVDLVNVWTLLKMADEKAKVYAIAVTDDRVLAGLPFLTAAGPHSGEDLLAADAFFGAAGRPEPMLSEGGGKRLEGSPTGGRFLAD